MTRKMLPSIAYKDINLEIECRKVEMAVASESQTRIRTSYLVLEYRNHQIFYHLGHLKPISVHWSKNVTHQVHI